MSIDLMGYEFLNKRLEKIGFHLIFATIDALKDNYTPAAAIGILLTRYVNTRLGREDSDLVIIKERFESAIQNAPAEWSPPSIDELDKAVALCKKIDAENLVDQEELIRLFEPLCVNRYGFTDDGIVVNERLDLYLILSGLAEDLLVNDEIA